MFWQEQMRSSIQMTLIIYPRASMIKVSIHQTFFFFLFRGFFVKYRGLPDTRKRLFACARASLILTCNFQAHSICARPFRPTSKKQQAVFACVVSIIWDMFWFCAFCLSFPHSSRLFFSVGVNPHTYKQSHSPTVIQGMGLMDSWISFCYNIPKKFRLLKIALMCSTR